MGMEFWKDGKLLHSTDASKKVEAPAPSVRFAPTVEMVALKKMCASNGGGILRVGDLYSAFPGEADEHERMGLGRRVPKAAPAPDPEPAAEPEEKPELDAPGPTETKVAAPTKRKYTRRN